MSFWKGESHHQKCWQYNLVRIARTWALVMVYSSVENWGISSAGWFCSLMAAYCKCGNIYYWKLYNYMWYHNEKLFGSIQSGWDDIMASAVPRLGNQTQLIFLPNILALAALRQQVGLPPQRQGWDRCQSRTRQSLHLPLLPRIWHNSLEADQKCQNPPDVPDRPASQRAWRLPFRK